jgi:hypothetical protein
MNRVKLRMERYACVQNTPEKPIASYFPAHSTSQPDDARLVQPRHVLHVCRFDRQTVRAARIVSANRSLRSASSSPAPGVTWTFHAVKIFSSSCPHVQMRSLRTLELPTISFCCSSRRPPATQHTSELHVPVHVHRMWQKRSSLGVGLQRYEH